jgi:Iap family predicted aminopeptidase
MNETIPVVVLGFKTVTLLLGGLITYFAAKAARKTSSDGLTYLAFGFATVTFGSLLAGIGDQVFGLETGAALIFENALTAVGFAVIAYSLYVTSGSTGRP